MYNRFNKSFLIVMVLIIMIVSLACSDNSAVDLVVTSDTSAGEIYLYGETHGVEEILEKELELWGNHYNDDNMRHLFIESPYYTGEFLNLWMESDNDDILEEIYRDWKGTAACNPHNKQFFKNIKKDFPETIFHGTDVGHQHDTTGKRYLMYLEKNNLRNSEKYLLTQEAIEQGKKYYEKSDGVYRENKMTENFVREFDNLKDQDIMGIYGSAHTGFETMDYETNSVPSMANQLKKIYGDSIYSEDLSLIGKDIKPLNTETIKVNGKDYEALYFGKQDLNGFKGYEYREFWLVENAYEDFKDNKKTGDVLPYDNYPMLIEEKQVFIIDLIPIKGSVERLYYRSDGNTWKNLPTTEGFYVEE